MRDTLVLSGQARCREVSGFRGLGRRLVADRLGSLGALCGDRQLRPAKRPPELVSVGCSSRASRARPGAAGTRVDRAPTDEAPGVGGARLSKRPGHSKRISVEAWAAWRRFQADPRAMTLFGNG